MGIDRKILLLYCAVSALVFLCLMLFGKMLKKDILGNGVKVGIVNSFFLSILWPYTFFVLSLGLFYDMIQGFRKL